MDLKPGMNTSAVGDKWTLPTSNVKNITAVDPPGVSSSYQFPAGKTNVKWAAVNEIGEHAYCVVQVDVRGKYVLLNVKCDHRSKFSNLSNWKEKA